MTAAIAAAEAAQKAELLLLPPAKAGGFHFHELADLEAAFRDAGFTDARTERNDEVRFGAHCMLGRKAAATS